MRSKYERTFAARLDELGVRYDYEAWRLPYYVKVPGGCCQECGSNQVVRRGWYTPDFWLPDYGLLVETKGKFTSRDRSKMQAVAQENPDERIVMVLMADNKLSKHSTTRYSQWCENNQIPYLVRSPVGLRTLKLEEIITATSRYSPRSSVRPTS